MNADQEIGVMLDRERSRLKADSDDESVEAWMIVLMTGLFQYFSGMWYTVKNTSETLQVVNFTSLEQLVNKLVNFIKLQQAKIQLARLKSFILRIKDPFHQRILRRNIENLSR